MDGRGLKHPHGIGCNLESSVRPSAMDGRGLKLPEDTFYNVFWWVRPSAMDGRGLKLDYLSNSLG